MKRLTTIDWSEHKLTIDKSHNCTIYTFKQPETVIYQVIWIVTSGIAVVKGDFRNWVFDRAFTPNRADAQRGLSIPYMNEKLRLDSSQILSIYDTEETVKLIKEFKKDFKAGYGRKMTDVEKEWIEDLIRHSDDETEYNYYAYRCTPASIETDDVPIGKRMNPYLNSIYDAFYEMCLRIKANDFEEVQSVK